MALYHGSDVSAGSIRGDEGQVALWNLLLHGLLELHETAQPEFSRMAELMGRYKDLPMDLADASLVSAAEVAGKRKVFSLDNHLRIYQLKDGSHFEVVP